MTDLQDPANAQSWVRSRMHALPARLSRAGAMAARVQEITDALNLSPEDRDVLQAAAWCSQVGYAMTARVATGHPQVDAALQLQYADAHTLAALVIGLEASPELITRRRLSVSFPLDDAYRHLSDVLAYLSVTTSMTGTAIGVDEWLVQAQRTAVGIGMREAIADAAPRLKALEKETEGRLQMQVHHDALGIGRPQQPVAAEATLSGDDLQRHYLEMTMKGLEAIA